MSIPILLAIITSVVALAGAIGSVLLMAYRMGVFTQSFMSALASLQKQTDRMESRSAVVDRVPLIEQSQAQMLTVLEEVRRRVSDIPSMRAKLDSVVEDVQEADLSQLRTEVAVTKQRLESMRGMPAVRDPRRDGT